MTIAAEENLEPLVGDGGGALSPVNHPRVPMSFEGFDETRGVHLMGEELCRLYPEDDNSF